MGANSSPAARVVANALVGALAGALPPVAWYVWTESTTGFSNGQGGLAWVAALGAATLAGGLAGGAVGAVGRGVRVVRLGNAAPVLLGACGGAVLGAVAVRAAAGLGDERSVALVLLAATVGVVLGMLSLTTPRSAGRAVRHPLPVAVAVAVVLPAVAAARAQPPAPDAIELTGHAEAIIFAGFSADSRVLTAVDERGHVRRWDAATGRLLSSRSDGPLRVEHPDLPPRDAADPARRAAFELLHPARSFATDGSAVARVTRAGTVRVRNLVTGADRELRAGDGLAYHGVALSPDGQALAAAAVRDGSYDHIRFWDPATGRPGPGSPIKKDNGRPDPPTRLAFSPDGRTLLSLGPDARLRLIDVATGHSRATAPAAPVPLTASFSPDGRSVALGVLPVALGLAPPGGEWFTPVEVFDTTTVERVASVPLAGLTVGVGWFLPGGRAFATQHPGLDGPRAYVQLRDVGTWKETVRLAGRFVAASPDGGVVLTEPGAFRPEPAAPPDRTLTAWDARTGEKLRQLPRAWAPSAGGWLPPDGTVVFSPDGRWLAVVRGTTVRVGATALLWGAAGSAPPVAPPPRPRGEPDPEAERLLRRLEERIQAAKTLRVEFDITFHMTGITPHPQEGTYAKGFLAMADGNRFRHEFSSPLAGYQKYPSVVVSDGKRVGGPHLGKESVLFPKAPLPAWHNEVLRSWLGRGGTVMSLMVLSEHVALRKGGRPTPEQGPRTSNVRLLPDEDVGGVRCRVVRYDLAWGVAPPGAGPVDVWVWLDPRTGLPVRRRMALGDGGHRATLTAAHPRFEIDPALDDRLFEVPE